MSSSSFDSSLVSSANSKRNSKSSFKPQTSSFMKAKKKVIVSKFKMRALDDQLKEQKAYRAQFDEKDASSLKSFKPERSDSPMTP